MVMDYRVNNIAIRDTDGDNTCHDNNDGDLVRARRLGQPRQHEALKQGKCWDCGDTAVPGRSKCQYHLEQAVRHTLDRMSLLQLRGMCVICGQRKRVNTLHCIICRDKYNIQQRIRRARKREKKMEEKMEEIRLETIRTIGMGSQIAESISGEQESRSTLQEVASESGAG